MLNGMMFTDAWGTDDRPSEAEGAATTDTRVYSLASGLRAHSGSPCHRQLADVDRA